MGGGGGLGGEFLFDFVWGWEEGGVRVQSTGRPEGGGVCRGGGSHRLLELKVV